MKAFIAMTLLSLSAQAYTEGVYTCSTGEGAHVAVYDLKTVNQIPFLTITTTHTVDGVAKTYVVKGVPTQFINAEGQETLTLGALQLGLQSGRPACAQ